MHGTVNGVLPLPLDILSQLGIADLSGAGVDPLEPT